MIVNTGKQEVADLIVGYDTPVKFDYIAVGTGTTGAQATDTALESELSANGFTRAQGTASSPSAYVGQVQKVFTATGTQNGITESGLFNDPSAGTMLCRQVFTAKNLEADDTLTVTWKITVSTS